MLVYTLPVLICATLAAANLDLNLPKDRQSVLSRFGNATFCCATLKRVLSDQTSYPNDTVYQQEQNGTNSAGYWSATESEQFPACRLTPKNTYDVSKAVAILSIENCNFAIRSGGHTPWANSSNVGPDGVTIDLSQLNQVTVANNKTQASIGPGARWGNVYQTLNAQGLGVSGGRVASVGVGGLTLGGGKSFFASKYGFVSDNVISFEVVTAFGVVLTASNETHRDLWRALQGGNSNFGVVTRFDVRTFPQGDLWAGQVVYPVTTLDQQLQELYYFTEATGATFNPPADAQVIFAYVTFNTYQIIANFYSYTSPTPNPPIFTNFTSIQPQLANSLRISNQTDFGNELNTGTPNGNRYLFATMTFGNNLDLTRELAVLANQTFQPFVAAGTPDITFSFVLQPLTKPMLSFGCGTNVLGLCPSDGNLVILDLTMQWGSAADDPKIYAAAQSLIDGAVQRAKARGVYNKYEYLNYAAQFQSPIQSYGEDNVRFLQKVSRKYDPLQVFQRKVGGYKLPRGRSSPVE